MLNQNQSRLSQFEMLVVGCLNKLTASTRQSCLVAQTVCASTQRTWRWPVFVLAACVAAALSNAVARADSAEELYAEAAKAAADGNSKLAVQFATKAIQRDGEFAEAYYLRGREHFRLAMIDAAVGDFDRYVQLRPQVASRQWERGIALYYADRFDEGAKQFELYQTFHDNDVENSVWRYLCVARDKDVATAQKTMLPIKADPRVPMMKIYDLYRGKATVDDVLKAARAGDPPPEVLAGRMFYADLYIGLYYEAQGDEKRAKRHIFKAADEHKNTRRVNRYMWDVARIHAQLLRAEKTATDQAQNDDADRS